MSTNVWYSTPDNFPLHRTLRSRLPQFKFIGPINTDKQSKMEWVHTLGIFYDLHTIEYRYFIWFILLLAISNKSRFAKTGGLLGLAMRLANCDDKLVHVGVGMKIA